MTRFCVIGDPHGDLKKIRRVPKNVDFYLITGDLGKVDLARKIVFENIERRKNGLPELEVDEKIKEKICDEVYFSTLGVLKYLAKYAPVYTIQGNVGLTTASKATKSICKVMSENSKMHLAKNVIRILDGTRVGFLEYFLDECWVKEFKPGNYKEKMKRAKLESKKAKMILKRFGKVDILVCHQPPYGFLDKVGSGAPKGWVGKHAGSKVILKYIKKFKPQYVFCGHIHEGEGKVKVGKSEVFNLGIGENFVVEM